MSLSLLDEDHYRGQKRAILGEIEELKRRIEVLERSAALGLFLAGTTTLAAPGSVLANSTEQPPDGRALFRAYGENGGFMVWEAINVGATAQTAIYPGAERVNDRLYCRHVTVEVTGGVSNCTAVVVTPGGSNNLYNDGVDICTLTVSAAGEVTVQRTGGTDTFKVLAIMIWQ